MKLPHLPPVRFAQHVIELEDDNAKVDCKFPSLPSLPMFIEAAAQSSAAFSKGAQPLMGFLATCKDVKLHSMPTSSACVMHIKKHFTSPAFGEYTFQAFAYEGTLLANGSIVLFHPNK